MSEWLPLAVNARNDALIYASVQPSRARWGKRQAINGESAINCSHGRGTVSTMKEEEKEEEEVGGRYGESRTRPSPSRLLAITTASGGEVDDGEDSLRASGKKTNR